MMFLKLTLPNNVGGEKKSLFNVVNGSYSCPLCGSPIYWSCPGSSGWAHCAKSDQASRVWKKGEFLDLDMCSWKGYARRRKDGKVEIYYYP